MLVVVALVKDVQANIERFLELNLANGADGVLLFLDTGTPDLVVPPAYQAHTAVVRLDDRDWGRAGAPPLNGRQRMVANLARFACARVGGVDWLFFIDGDEVALLDRTILDTVPAALSAVRLTPLESVSDPDTDETLFKRPLTKQELGSLTRASLLSRPSNARYFHGHLSGKVGIRPFRPARFRVHTAVDLEGEELPAFEHPTLRHLHFQSTTYDDFVRKWHALATSGSPPGVRGRRGEILEAFRDLEGQPAEVREARQRALYAHHVHDDGEALQRAGVLERVDLAVVRSRPRPAAVDLVRRLDEELTRLSALPLRLFLPRVPDHVLREALARLSG